MKTIITVEELYMKARTNSVETPILKDVIAYLIRSPGISGKTLAKVLEVKRSNLSGAILLITGVTLNDFLKQWKLLHAMYMLRNTELSYEDVAHQCGYASMRGFTKFFDTNLHCTPYEYRASRVHGNRKG